MSEISSSLLSAESSASSFVSSSMSASGEYTPDFKSESLFERMYARFSRMVFFFRSSWSNPFCRFSSSRAMSVPTRASISSISSSVKYKPFISPPIFSSINLKLKFLKVFSHPFTHRALKYWIPFLVYGV
ncbi:hypothetical protein K8Q94_00495 [Candidatus Nomurabacteria bacterium]|nr:hypothetical protein [Candidatus Nomurabacteria bacterium]